MRVGLAVETRQVKTKKAKKLDLAGTGKVKLIRLKWPPESPAPCVPNGDFRKHLSSPAAYSLT